MTRLPQLIVAASLALLAAACLPNSEEADESTTTTSTVSSPDTETPPTSTTTTDTPSTTNDSIPSRSVERVYCDSVPEPSKIVCEAYELIQNNYVDDVSDDILVEAGTIGLREWTEGGSSSEPIVCPLPADAFQTVCDVAGTTDLTNAETAEAIVAGFALFGLDPNSAYFDEEALDLLQEEQEGEIEGIGALVSPEDETIEGDNKQCGVISETCRIVIASTIEGTPAEAAGLQSGDVIVGVNGDDIVGWTIDEVTAKVRGPAGTDVTLTVERGAETFDVTITRASVVIPVIETELFGDDGYIRLRLFNGTADEQFQSAVIEMVAEGVDDLVIDLRNNPGGLLDTAIEVTSVFLPTGDVVVTEGPDNGRTYSVTGASLVPEDVDVIVIVNGGSASASEVFSAVLQERDRATIVGENTFGKNTVQQRFSLSNGGAIKLTIARWLTPEGLDFGGTGVTPDVEREFSSDITAEELVASVVDLG